MFYPSFEAAVELAEDYSVIPVSLTLHADMDTPISIFKRLEARQYCFLLESVEGGSHMARYSFAGRNPFLIFRSKEHTVTLQRNGETTTYTAADPIAELEGLCARYRSPVLPGLPRFSGGAVGFFSYDAVRYIERLADPPPDDLAMDDISYMFTDELVAFDHERKKLIIMVNLHVGEGLRERYGEAMRRIEGIREELSRPIPAGGAAEPVFISAPVSNLTKEQFCAMVEAAKEEIAGGEIFQVVLSQRFAVGTNADPFNAYRALRLINPSPYMYYLKLDDYQIVGSSPEMLVRVEGDRVQTSPIAGTKPRGKTPREDEELTRALLADEKENAEHIMLVDLGRNDIGKISEFGSVSVDRLKFIQYFSHVMHMTSLVSGRLRPDKSMFDAVRAHLPAGTLSGAPKVRAMEIIDALEPVRRGAYGGAIGYIGFDGTLDSCIVIRTAVFKEGKAYVQAGGGIVYDSDPLSEYEESVNKAAATLRAIERSGELV